MIKILNIGPKNAHILDIEIVKQPSFVKVYHPECSHCTTMKPAWNKLTKTMKNNYKGNMSLFNVHADALANIKTPALKSINGYPSLKIIKNRKGVIDYAGDRSYEDMLKFCLKNINLTKILEVYKSDKYKNKFLTKRKKYKKQKYTRKNKKSKNKKL
jgi:thiol-disulfide isomerase/thioredoxin